MLFRSHAYRYFGGATRILTPDNLKTGVTRHGTGEVILNPTYQEMAEHYNTCILPARVRHPKDYRRKNVIGNSMKDSQNTPIIRYL